MANSQLAKDDIEASAKLVGSDGAPGGNIEIRPSCETPKNGINIAEVRQAFAGMGKEELMKFANDPFYVRLRWFLFVLFWIFWFGMLGGAVVIIVMAPKCSGPPPNKFMDRTIYAVKLDSVKNEAGEPFQSFEGLLKIGDYVKDLGGLPILLDSIAKHTSEGSEYVINFKEVDAKYGAIDSLKNVLSRLKSQGISVILKLTPNHVSVQHDWFNQSVHSTSPYKDYFVWKPMGSDGKEPNNWRAHNDLSAWTFNGQRKEYYLHQFDEKLADLNFNNPNVVGYFSDVFKFWLDVGFSGIHVDKAAYLAEDPEFKSEIPTSLEPSTGVVGDYSFLQHSRTKNLDLSYKILKQWSAVIANASGVLSVSDVEDYVELDDFAQMVVRPLDVRNSISVTDLNAYISKVSTKPRQIWEWTSTNLDSDATVALNTLFALLPGNSVIQSGTELGRSPFSEIKLPLFKNLGSASSSLPEQANYGIFKEINELRGSPSIREGSHAVSVVNRTVLILTRMKEGNPSYSYILNTYNSTLVDLNAVTRSFGLTDPKVVVASLGFKQDNRDKLLSGTMSLDPNEFAVVEYTPV